MSTDLMTRLSNYLASGTGIYLNLGNKVITASVHHNHMFPTEIHLRLRTPVVVTSLQEFYRQARLSLTVWDGTCYLGDLTDQEILAHTYYYYPKDHLVYLQKVDPWLEKLTLAHLQEVGPRIEELSLAYMFAVPLETWTKEVRPRHERIKAGTLDCSIFKRISPGTEFFFSEPGYPAVTLTLEKFTSPCGAWSDLHYVVTHDQPCGVPVNPAKNRFEHLSHLRNWYRKHVMQVTRKLEGDPMYSVYFATGSHRGLTLGQYLDSKDEKLFLTADKDGKDLFPVGSERFKDWHSTNVKYIEKHILPSSTSDASTPQNVMAPKHLMDYLLANRSFADLVPEIKTAMLRIALADRHLAGFPPGYNESCQAFIAGYDPPASNSSATNSSATNSSSNSSSSNSSSSSSSPATTATATAIVDPHTEQITKLQTIIDEQQAYIKHLEEKAKVMRAMIECVM